MLETSTFMKNREMPFAFGLGQGRLVAVTNWELVAVAVVGGWRLTVGDWWSPGAVLKGCP